MKKILLFALLVGGAANAQTTLFEDSFDTYDDFLITDVGEWTLTDVDVLPTYGFNTATFPEDFAEKSFQVFNHTMTEPPLEISETSDWTAHSGDKVMACFAAVPDGDLGNDDWLISPQITLAATGNSLSFWAKAADSEFGDERFRVLVSIGTTDTADFLDVLTDEPDEATPADLTWHEYTYDLSAFDGMQVYIAIQCVSFDQFGFLVDDFKVTTTALGTPSFFNQNFAAYPNPANSVLNISAKNGVQMEQAQLTDLNGRVVRSLKLQGVTETQINTADLASGAYFLKVQSSAGIGVQKIIKN